MKKRINNARLKTVWLVGGEVVCTDCQKRKRIATKSGVNCASPELAKVGRRQAMSNYKLLWIKVKKTDESERRTGEEGAL